MAEGGPSEAILLEAAGRLGFMPCDCDCDMNYLRQRYAAEGENGFRDLCDLLMEQEAASAAPEQDAA